MHVALTAFALSSSLLFASPPPAAPASPPSGGSGVKLLVLDLAHGAGVDQGVASAVGESVLAAVSALGTFTVTTPRDLQTLLGLERQRQMLGCSAESSSCMTELAGALGARFVLSGSLSRVGATYQLQLQMLDSERAQPMGRSLRFAPTVEELRSQLPYQVAEATGAPPPKQPSKVVPYSLIGGGAASILGAAAVGVITYSQIQVLQHDLQLGANGDRSVLQPLSYYQDQSSALQRQQVIAWSLASAGAALISTGIVLNSFADAGPGAHFALAPTPNGFAIAGIFP